MGERIHRDEFREIEEIIRRILEQTLRGTDGSLPAGFHVIVSGGEISRGGDSRDTPVSRIVDEPPVEIYEEDGEVRILAEVPGADVSTTHLQVTGRVLRIYADGGERRFKTSVELPPVRTDTMVSRLAHGVLEITFSNDLSP